MKRRQSNRRDISRAQQRSTFFGRKSKPASVRPRTLRMESLEERRVLTAEFVTGGQNSNWLIEDTFGATIEDASLSGPPSQGDAFDGAARVNVNGTALNGALTRSGQTVSFAPQSIAGLVVQLHYYVSPTTATARSFLSLANPTGSPISVPVDWNTNLGSDTNTVIQQTSSGDTTFNTSDRWLVTDDPLFPPGDPAVTTVLFGTGLQSNPLTSVNLGGAAGDVLTSQYNVTVPAGSTRSLMWFHQINDTSANAITNAATFDTNPAVGSDLVSGLTAAQLAEVVNWQYAQNVVINADAGATATSFTFVRSGNSLFLTQQTTFPGPTVTTTVTTFDINLINSLTINGGASANDSLVLNFDGGGYFSFPGGLSFNGGAAGNDAITIHGGAVGTVTHSFTNANDGSINIDGGLINYTGLEPIADNMDPANRIFTFGAGADAITLLDDGVGGNNMSTIDSNLAEAVTFTHPTTSLTINAGAGDSLLINMVDPLTTSTLNVPGAPGPDTITVTSLNAGGTISLNSSGATSLGGITAGAGLNVNAGGAVTDTGNLAVTGIASFTGSSIVLGDAAETTNFQFLRFNSAGGVSITEDSAMDITLSNTAASLGLAAAGNITDVPGASIIVTTTAALNAGVNDITLAEGGADNLTVGGNANFLADDIAIGGPGVVSFGSVTYNSTNNTTIQEDNATAITGVNTAGSLLITSSGGISDSGANQTIGGQATFTGAGISFNIVGPETLVVGGNASFTATAGSIAVTDGGGGAVITFGSLTYNSGANPTAIFETNATVLTGASAADSVVINSQGSITDTGATQNLASTAGFNANGNAITLADVAGESLTTGTVAVFSNTSAITLGSAGTVNLGSIQFQSTGAVVVQEDSSTQINEIVLGGNTANSLSLTSAGAITDTSTVLTVTNNASFSGTGIDIGGAGQTTNFGSLTYNSTGVVDIQEDSAMSILGANTANSLILSSTSSISEGAGAVTQTVTNNATFQAAASVSLVTGSGDVLSVGGVASFAGSGIDVNVAGTGTANFGSLNYNSAGIVGVVENTATNITGANTAASAAINSGGAITDDAGTSQTITGSAGFFAASGGAAITLADNATDTLSVGGNARFSGSSITIGPAGTANFGTLTFSSSGAVNIQEDSNIDLSSAIFNNTAASLVLTSVDDIGDGAGANLTVTGNARFVAGGAVGDDIDLGDVGTTTDFGSLRFNATNGDVIIHEDSSIVLDGASNAQNILALTANVPGSTLTDIGGGATSLTVPGISSLGSHSGITLGDAGELIDFGALITNTAAGNGDQHIVETNGIAGLSMIAGTGAITLISGGSLTDNDVAVDISADRARLQAVGGIGDTSIAAGDAIQTVLNRLDLHNQTSGQIFVRNTGALTLDDLGGAAGAVNGVGGGGEIRASSPLVFAADATTSGGMTYTAADSAGTGDDITLNAGVDVVDTTAGLVFNVGDNLEMDPTSTITAATTVTINLDATGGGVADPGVGSTTTIDGTVTSSGGTTAVNGFTDNDALTIASAANTVENIGSNLLFTGGGGVDSLTVIDSGDASGDGTLLLPVDISGGVAGAGTISRLIDASATRTIAFAGFAVGATVNLQTSNTGNDVVEVTPNANVIYNLDGNLPTPFPADTLVYDGTGVKFILGADSGQITSPGFQPVNFQEFELVQPTAGNTLDDVYNLPADGAPSSLRIDRDPTGAFLQFFFDNDTTGGPAEVLVSTQLYASIGTITVNGSGDDETLIVDHSLHLIAKTINFNGGGNSAPGVEASGPPGDTLVVTGNPGSVAARTTYVVGDNQADGTWVIDPDGNRGAGLAVAANGDEMTVNFTGLEPVDDDTPAAILDVVYDPGDADSIRIENGGLLNGAPSLRVFDVAGTFETFRFANKTTVNLHLNDGADTADTSYTIAAAGLTTLNLFGHGTAGVGADDNATDTFILTSHAAGVAHNLSGQGGSDLFRTSFATFTLDNLLGTTNIVGGETAADADLASLQDAGDGTADLAVTLTSTTLTNTGAGTITYGQLESFYYESTAGNDTIDITSTSGADGGTSYFISGDGGSDTITIGNQSADFSVNANGSLASDGGSLDAILGQITIAPDRSGSLGTADIVNVDDSGTAGLNGAATIGTVAAFAFSLAPHFASEIGDATVLTNFAPALIRYFHTSYTSNGGNRLEFLNVFGSDGQDTIAVNATTATNTTRIDVHDGNDFNTVTINGDGLSANNIFHGSAGNDQFVLNITAHIGATAVFPVTSVEVHGDANGAPVSENRDRLVINDNNAGFARDLNWDYLNTPGDLDILANAAGAGLAGPVNGTMAVNVRTMETVIFNSTGTNDIVRATGTTTSDFLTAAQVTASSALVFLNGDPYLNAPPADLTVGIHDLPGIAGGGAGPDLLIGGIAAATGLRLNGGGNVGGTGDRAVVYAKSEANIVTGGVLDIFGFGAGVLIPGNGVGNAYDTITVNDASVATTNNATGALVTVFLDTATFDQTNPDTPFQQAGLTVNAGDEAVAQPSGISDNISATVSANFNIQINGNLPNLVLGPDGLPIGDQLNITGPGDINIFSDKQTPPNVTNTFSGNPGPFGITHSSIERLMLDAGTAPASGRVNLIGDNNNPAIDQPDNFVVRGRDIDGNLLDVGYQEMTVSINGSAPILINGVQRLSVYGYDRLTPAGDVPADGIATNDNDTLDIRAYADNGASPPTSAPRNWGVDVFFDEGVPAGTDGLQQDFLIYHTAFSLGGGGSVSENIVVQPSGPDNGEVRVTNAADGSLVVAIQYVNNTDITVIDDDGSLSDTDTLTLRGTDGSSPQTSGNEAVVVDFDAAGTPAAPQVTVSDGATPLYRLRSVTGIQHVNFDLLAGNDRTTIRTPATGVYANGVRYLTVLGGGGDDTTLLDLEGRHVFHGAHRVLVDGGTGRDSLSVSGTPNLAIVTATYNPGPSPGQGQLIYDDTGSPMFVDFTGLEPVIDTVVAATLVVNANPANNAINYTQGSVAANGLVTIDTLESIEFSNKTTLTINALAGSDAINLNNASAPTALTTINVNGGDPTGSGDVLTVNGVAATTTINVSTANITGALGGGAAINYSGIENLRAVAGASTTLAVNATAPVGPVTYTLTPGVAADEGRIETIAIPIDFKGYGSGSTIDLNADIAGDVDDVIVNGTAGVDQFTVAATTGDISWTTSGVARATITTTDVDTLRLQGLDGDDAFTVTGTQAYSLIIDGGNATTSDVVTANGNGTSAVGVTLGATAGVATITGGGLDINTSGIEVVNANAAGQNLTVSTRTTSEKVVVDNLSASGARVTANGLSPVINGTNIGTLSVDGSLGSDTLEVVYTNAAETITVTAAAVSSAGLETVNQIGFENLRVLGLAGNDIFNVTPGAIPIFVDGGDPIGSTAGDDINLSPPGAFTIETGPENDEGGLVSAGLERVSWDHIESVTVVGGPGPGLILGTNGDDDITIIARDITTHLLANGVQDFTVSVNSGPSVLFLNTPVLFVDALAGDDDIVAREPAPLGAIWNVQVTIAGGPPATITGAQGDLFSLETPGTQTAEFTPLGIDSATLNDVTNTSLFSLVNTFTIPLFYVSSPGGIEQVLYQGLGGGDTLTVNGTAGIDNFIVNPAAGTGSLRSSLSPTFDFSGATAVTLNGAAGFDTAIVNGTAGNDAVTSPVLNQVALGGGTVTLGAGLDRFELHTFAGDDNINIDITLTPLAKHVNAGDGNDTIDLAGSVDADIFGGIGNDVIVGTPVADNIFGGAGNDTIDGLAGIDNIYGEAGNDSIVGGLDADNLDGGDGVDTFTWNPGDGSDVVTGGNDQGDILVFNGNAAGIDAFSLFAVSNSTHLGVLLGAALVDTTGVEQVNVNGLGGTDTFSVGDLATTEVKAVRLNFGPAGDLEAANISGRTVSDNVAITQTGLGVNIAGLKYDVNVEGITLADPDFLSFSGFGGNDTISISAVLSVLFSSSEVTINGGDGDDFITGFGTLNGDAGNDTLVGGVDAQTISGGTGNDFIVGNAGADTLNGNDGEDTFVTEDTDNAIDIVNGGLGFDTILIQATSANDRIDALQVDVDTLQYEVSGVTGDGNLGTVDALEEDTFTLLEEVRIVAGSGDDNIRVTQPHNIAALRFTVDGGAPGASDRLTVVDAGLGDTTIHRIGGIAGNGSYTINPVLNAAAPIVYTDVEFTSLTPLNPVTGGTGSDGVGRLFVFKHDPFESNNSRLNATFLGSNSAINVDPTIDPGVDLFAPGDEDWYRIVAQYTGDLDIRVFFAVQGPLGNGQPGLPGAGNLDIALYDVDGAPAEIAGSGPLFGINDAGDNERIRIPAVEGQTYYLRVRGAPIAGPSDAINVYNVSVINTPAPKPFDLELDDVIATSSVTGGILFTPVDQRFNGGAALPAVPDFFDGKDIVFTSGPLNGQRGRVVDYIGATRTFIFAANTFTTTPVVGNTFQIESIDTGRSQLDNITRDNTPTIFLRVDDARLLNDIPAGSFPGDATDLPLTIPFETNTTDVDVPLGDVGFRVAVFRTENNTHTLVGYASQVPGSPGNYVFTFPSLPSPLPDGSHFIRAKVEMIDPANPQQAQGFGEFGEALEIVVDTAPPPVFFGLPSDPDDGLAPESDSGFNSNPETLIDEITNDTTPKFFGQAEANAVVRVFVDAPQPGFPTGNGIFEPGIDFQIAFDVAEPLDGTNQYPQGYWEANSNVNLNAAPFSPIDGFRRIFVTAEDVAGNINAAPFTLGVDVFEIFIDTQGPQVTSVSINQPDLYALATGNVLLQVNSAAPSIILSSTTVTGLVGGETLRGIDVLPRTVGTFSAGTLFGLGVSGGSAHVYAINRGNGQATVIGPAFAVNGASTGYGFDFNPTNGLLRITNDSEENISFDITTGVATPQAALVGAVGVVGSAYDRNDEDPLSPTTLFGIDFATDFLVRQGDVNGLPLGPASGIVTPVGALGVNADANTGFDIVAGSNVAFASINDILHTVNLATGTATAVGTIGTGQDIVGLAAARAYDLFDPKPSTDGPSPLVNSLVITFQDLPARTIEFLVAALKADIADSPGLYQVKGDFNGIIPILDVNVTNQPVIAGEPAFASVELVFRLRGPDGVFNTSDDIGKALPDDRFTLTIIDSIADFATNRLDGESNAAEPQSPPTFPSGDGQPGGNFVARFTIDSRPELGVYAAGSAWLDINGNSKFDPDNLDYTNRDITYVLGFTSDNLFAGKFMSQNSPNDRNVLFDKLAAYGRVGTTSYRWLIDTDNDGVPDVETADPANVNGLPVAGNFGPFAGDEVGLFTNGNTWRFDTDHNWQVDASLVFPITGGQPIVGDFDGDQRDDLGLWRDDTFWFDLSSIDNPAKANVSAFMGGIDGSIDSTFRFGFIGVGEVPVAADMNMDGIEDVGLFVPAREGVTPREGSEWYFLLSGVSNNNTGGAGNPAIGVPLGPTITGTGDTTPGSYDINPAFYGNASGVPDYLRGRIVLDPQSAGSKIVRFEPVPFANDLYMQYGDEFSLPLVGNFDPPITNPSSQPNTTPNTNPRNSKDVNNDGFINALDVLVVVNRLNTTGPGPAPAAGFVSAPFYDVNADKFINVLDALNVLNHLNSVGPGPATAGGAGEGEGEGEGADAYFSELGTPAGNDSTSASGGDEELFEILARETEVKKARRRHTDD